MDVCCFPKQSNNPWKDGVGVRRVLLSKCPFQNLICFLLEHKDTKTSNLLFMFVFLLRFFFYLFIFVTYFSPATRAVRIKILFYFIICTN